MAEPTYSVVRDYGKQYNRLKLLEKLLVNGDVELNVDIINEEGDFYYRGADGNIKRLPISENHTDVISVEDGVPVWKDLVDMLAEVETLKVSFEDVYNPPTPASNADIIYPADTGGVFVRVDSIPEMAIADNVFYLLRSGVYYQRIYDSTEISMKWFGAKGDGSSNDTEAFERMSDYINSVGGGVTIEFPYGTYIAGKQTKNVGSGGWLYVPSDIIKISNCTKPVIFVGNNSTIKMEDGLRFGTFNDDGTPVYHTLPYYGDGTNEIAIPGVIFELSNNKSIIIKEINLDGNSQKLYLGGKFGDLGWQLPADGILAFDNDNLEIKSINSFNHGRDGIMVRNSAVTEAEPVKYINLSNSKFTYNGRQGFSWVGGNHCHAIDCEFSHTGRAMNEGAEILVASAPGAGLDIEPEANTPYDGIITSLTSLVGGSGYVDGVYEYIPLTGGNGKGAKATITVEAGAVTDVQIVRIYHRGVDYQLGDELTADSLPTDGTPFTINVGSVMTGEAWLYCINGRFENCTFSDNYGCGMVTDGGGDNSHSVYFGGCTFIGIRDWAIWVTKPYYQFNSCKVFGAIAHSFIATGHGDPRRTKWKSCEFIYDRAQLPLEPVLTEIENEQLLIEPISGEAEVGADLLGTTPVYVDLGAAAYPLFDGCTFDYNEMPLPWSWNAQWHNCTFKNNSSFTSYTKGLYTGENHITCLNTGIDFYGVHFKGPVFYNGTVRPVSAPYIAHLVFNQVVGNTKNSVYFLKGFDGTDAYVDTKVGVNGPTDPVTVVVQNGDIVIDSEAADEAHAMWRRVGGIWLPFNRIKEVSDAASSDVVVAADTWVTGASVSLTGGKWSVSSQLLGVTDGVETFFVRLIDLTNSEVLASGVAQSQGIYGASVNLSYKIDLIGPATIAVQMRALDGSATIKASTTGVVSAGGTNVHAIKLS